MQERICLAGLQNCALILFQPTASHPGARLDEERHGVRAKAALVDRSHRGLQKCCCACACALQAHRTLPQSAAS